MNKQYFSCKIDLSDINVSKQKKLSKTFDIYFNVLNQTLKFMTFHEISSWSNYDLIYHKKCPIFKLKNLKYQKILRQDAFRRIDQFNAYKNKYTATPIIYKTSIVYSSRYYNQYSNLSTIFDEWIQIPLIDGEDLRIPYRYTRQMKNYKQNRNLKRLNTITILKESDKFYLINKYLLTRNQTNITNPKKIIYVGIEADNLLSIYDEQHNLICKQSEFIYDNQTIYQIERIIKQLKKLLSKQNISDDIESIKLSLYIEKELKKIKKTVDLFKNTTYNIYDKVNNKILLNHNNREIRKTINKLKKLRANIISKSCSKYIDCFLKQYENYLIREEPIRKKNKEKNATTKYRRALRQMNYSEIINMLFRKMDKAGCLYSFPSLQNKQKHI